MQDKPYRLVATPGRPRAAGTGQPSWCPLAWAATLRSPEWARAPNPAPGTIVLDRLPSRMCCCGPIFAGAQSRPPRAPPSNPPPASAARWSCRFVLTRRIDWRALGGDASDAGALEPPPRPPVWTLARPTRSGPSARLRCRFPRSATVPLHLVFTKKYVRRAHRTRGSFPSFPGGYRETERRPRVFETERLALSGGRRPSRPLPRPRQVYFSWSPCSGQPPHSGPPTSLITPGVGIGGRPGSVFKATRAGRARSSRPSSRVPPRHPRATPRLSFRNT